MNSVVGDQILSVLAFAADWTVLMASKQSVRDGSRKEAPEHWVKEFIALVVLRVTIGSVSVKGRSHEPTVVAPVGTVSEVTIGHKQMKPASHSVTFRNMVLELNRITYLKEVTWQILIYHLYISYGTLATRRVCCWRVIPTRYDCSI